MGRLWTIAAIAARFSVLPSLVAKDLDADPERLSVKCASMLAYAEAKSALDHSKDQKSLESWAGSKMMELAMRFRFERAKKVIGG